MKAAEDRERAFDAEKARLAEEAYMSRVKEAAQKVDPPQWFGRKKVDWYS